MLTYISLPDCPGNGSTYPIVQGNGAGGGGTAPAISGAGGGGAPA